MADSGDSVDGAAANTKNDDDDARLLAEFLHSYEDWRMHVDKMEELEEFLTSSSCSSSSISLLTKGTTEDDVHPIQYIRQLLTRDEENEAEDANAMERGREIVDDNHRVESGCKDDGEDNKLQSNADTINTISTHLPSSSSLSLEELSKALFQPGMKFLGRITIPGLSMGRLHDTNTVLSGNEDDSEGGEEVEDEEYIMEVEVDSSTVVSHSANQALESAEDVSGHPTGGRTTNQESSHKSHDGMGGIPYELTVLRLGTDPLGNDFIQAKHSAYDDEQVVHIQTMIVDVDDNLSEGGTRQWLEVSYEDGETVCKGGWNPNKFRLEGRVYQRAITNDGIFHSSDSATHIFTLYPCTYCFPRERDKGVGENEEKLEKMERDLLSKNTRAIVAHRLRVQDALQEVLQRYFNLSHSLSFDSTRRGNVIHYSLLVKQKEIISKLRGCHWTDLVAGYFLCSEQISAEFRRRVYLLNGLKFESTDDQLRCIEQWKEAHMDLAAAHSEWDGWSREIKGLVLFDHEGSVFVPWLASQRRLHLNFESLENAYQRASARLPRSDLENYEIPRTQVGELLGITCTICQSLMDGDRCLFELPCSHVFHKACAQQWLHDNSSCPMCRFGLTKNITN